jgi:hypothetical protein
LTCDVENLEAQQMLRDGKRSQADIALATGFAEQSHFSRVFKESSAYHRASGNASIATDALSRSDAFRQSRAGMIKTWDSTRPRLPA